MTPEQTRTLAFALKTLSSRKDAEVLLAARATAVLIGATGLSPSAIASAIAAHVVEKTQTQPGRSFASLSGRAARKRMVVMARQRGILDADKARLAELRERTTKRTSDDLTTGEIAWLDDLWQARMEGAEDE